MSEKSLNVTILIFLLCASGLYYQIGVTTLLVVLTAISATVGVILIYMEITLGTEVSKLKEEFSSFSGSVRYFDDVIGEVTQNSLSAKSQMDSVLNSIKIIQDNKLSSESIQPYLTELENGLDGLISEIHAKNFTIVWNSLPYSKYYSRFNPRDKALFFDAITTGDWSRVNARVRDFKD